VNVKSLFLILSVALTPFSAAAQNLFEAAVLVNDSAITNFEIQQRVRYLEVLRTPGNLFREAETALIEDRIAQEEARKLGISIGEDALNEGLIEFAGRFNLTPDQFVDELTTVGVEPQTLRDFVRNGMLWREVVGQYFGARANVSEEEIDAALSLSAGGGAVSVRLAEIAMPLVEGTQNQTIQLAQDLSKSIRTQQEFIDAVMIYSVSPSAQNDGDLGWLPISQFPPELGSQFLTMSPGQVTEPMPFGNSVVVFQMRGLRETRIAEQRALSVDYVTLNLAGGRSAETLAQASAIVDRVDTCLDLQAEAAAIGQDRFQRITQSNSRVPRNIAKELAGLDNGEISTNLTTPSGNDLVVLMLCTRTRALQEGEREQIRNLLFQQRIETLGSGLMQDLKADAQITRQ
jgi:peptidyl-prolyl cis-trans isomerase SurA